jgi:adenosylhomocysteine nucleosidase
VFFNRPIILTALKMEASAVRRALGGAVDIRVIGIRAIRMPEIDTAKFDGIILAGLAGALDPSLQIGDIVVDVCSATGKLSLAGATHIGVIHSSGEIITAPAGKSELFTKTRALAVDMESAIVGARAAALGLPFLHIRAISDRAQDAVDPAVLSFINPFGAVRPLKLATALLGKPSLVAQIRHLRRDSKIALSALCTAIKALV